MHTPIDHERCEDAVSAVLHEGLRSVVYVPALTAAGAIHARVVPRAPRGCRSMLNRQPLLLHESSGPAAFVDYDLSHELLHLGFDIRGVPRPHREDEVSLAGAMLRMPLAPCRQIVREIGLDPVGLWHEYPAALPSEVAVRCALAAGGTCQIYWGRSLHPALVVPAEHTVPLGLVMQSYLIVQAVHLSGARAANDQGLIAAPFEEPTRRGVRRGVVVLGSAVF